MGVAQVTRERTPGAVTVLAAIVLLTLNLRAAVTGLSPLLGRISADVPLSTTQAGILGSLPPFSFAAAGLLAPLLLRRLAAERIVLLVLVVVSVGQGLRPWASGPWPFLGLSLLTLLGIGTGNVVLPALVKAWFPGRIATVTAVYVTGLTTGTALPPTLAVPVADAVARRTGSSTTGWHLALAWWGVLALVCVLPWIRPALHPRTTPARSAGPARAACSARAGDSRPAPGLTLWRSRTAWGVALVFGVNSLSTYAMFSWLPTRLADAGMDAAASGRVLAVFAAMGIPAALVVPQLTARAHNQFWLVLHFAVLFALGELGLLLSPLHGAVLWAVVAGWGSGAFPLALTLVGLRTRSASNAGALSGFAQGSGYLMAGFGPLVVGILRQTAGGWPAAFGFLWATLLFMVLGGWLASGRHTVEDDLARSGHAVAAAGPPGGTTAGA